MKSNKTTKTTKSATTKTTSKPKLTCKIKSIFSPKSSHPTTETAGYAPLSRADIALIMAYLLRNNNKSWYTIRHGDKSDLDLIFDAVNGFPIVVIDQHEAEEYVLSKDNLSYGFYRMNSIDKKARREEMPNWRPVDVAKTNDDQKADLILQYGISYEAKYTNNMPKVMD